MTHATPSPAPHFLKPDNSVRDISTDVYANATPHYYAHKWQVLFCIQYVHMLNHCRTDFIDNLLHNGPVLFFLTDDPVLFYGSWPYSRQYLGIPLFIYSCQTPAMALALYIPPCVHSPPHPLHPPPADKPLRIRIQGPLETIIKLLPDIAWHSIVYFPQHGGGGG